MAILAILKYYTGILYLVIKPFFQRNSYLQIICQHMCNQIQPYFAASSSALRNMNERIHLQKSSLTMECNGIDKRFSVCEVVKNFIGSGPSTVGPFPLVAHPRTVSEGTPLRGYPPFGRWSPPADVACHSVIIYVCIFCLRSLPSVDIYINRHATIHRSYLQNLLGYIFSSSFPLAVYFYLTEIRIIT